LPTCYTPWSVFQDGIKKVNLLSILLLIRTNFICEMMKMSPVKKNPFKKVFLESFLNEPKFKQHSSRFSLIFFCIVIWIFRTRVTKNINENKFRLYSLPLYSYLINQSSTHVVRHSLKNKKRLYQSFLFAHFSNAPLFRFALINFTF